jgi:hypothetical protein
LVTYLKINISSRWTLSKIDFKGSRWMFLNSILEIRFSKIPYLRDSSQQSSILDSTSQK